MSRSLSALWFRTPRGIAVIGLGLVLTIIAGYVGGGALKTSLFSADQKSRIASTARAQIGKPYTLGANGPDVFDCSALTKYVLKQAVGVDLPRTSREQAAIGRDIPLAQVGVGDLLFFATQQPGMVSHVGVVTRVDGGAVWMTNANSVEQKVVEEKVAGYWTKTYMFAREITDITKDDVADAATPDPTVTPAGSPPPSPTGVAYVAPSGKAAPGGGFPASEVGAGAARPG